MKRLFPHPLLAVVLLVFWLMLQQSIALGQILLGGVIAIGASLAAGAIIPERLRVRRPLKVLKLAAVAGLDIIQSNIAVLVILLNPWAKPKGEFIEIPLEVTQPFALAVLACLLTATPGSAWLEYDGEKSTVLVHVFNVDDPDEWAATIKKRYEPLLLEIFP